MNMKRPTSFAGRWSDYIAADGYTGVPNLLIDNQAALGITSSELNVLIVLIRYRWSKADPYPSVEAIASKMGAASQTVRNNLRSLEGKRLIKRRFRTGNTTQYSLELLISKLEALPQRRRSKPVQKWIDPSPNMRGSPYQNMDTKEDPTQKENIRRMRKQSGSCKTMAIGDIIALK